MKIHKKITAILAAFILCASAAAPCGYVCADNEEGAATAAADSATEPTTEEQSNIITSGDFSYTVIGSGKISIENCTSTDKELTVPETIDGLTVTELGKKAFGKDHENCPFETIALPSTIDYISADNPFVYCKNLTAVTVDGANSNFTSEDGILYSADKKTLVCYPESKSGSSFTVPEGVEKLGTAAIYNTELSEIKLPASLKEIGRHGLSSNEKLTAVDLSETSINSIGDFGFSDCSSLSKVKLPEVLFEIGGGAFMKCEKLKEITLPPYLLIIGQNAFMNTGLSEIVVPESVESIGYSAFGYYLDNEGKETADPNFVVIGVYNSAAHKYCTDSDADYGYKNSFTFKTETDAARDKELLALDRITEGNYEYAFVEGGAVITQCTAVDKILTVPEKLGGAPVTGIYPVAFSSCFSEEIILPETLKYLREMAFYSCPSLKKITLPQSLESVGNNAFDRCTALVEVNTGGALTIGNNVFLDCAALKTLTVSGKCTSIGDQQYFLSCSALESINITEDGGGSYASVDGVLMNSDKTELIAYPAAHPDKSYKMPDSVKKVKTYAFLNCSVIEDIVLSKNLTELEEYAFYDCKNLKTFRAGKKLETIGKFAFGYRYNENADAQQSDEYDILVEEFKLYAPKNSAAYTYAGDNGIEVITGTIRIGSKNLRIGMLGAVGGIGAALLIALIGAFTGMKIRKKRDSAKYAPIMEKPDDEKSADDVEAENEAPIENDREETENDDEA